ncbi:protein VASCULAR ASSOCIATED DEATH 1, chloroplastic-like [Papaver somniferum]|uniref:protein VASCULAR ASSOCIATED DEATH 1, chloroplastic-like n=1 Tax=Papaver somniferum TaxID=3469 RepID=UPI000E6F522B|nr:protein VASCULAR ASSOCIATED DEATH 1, chloroplastic-like [Papaver somniferum]
METLISFSILVQDNNNSSNSNSNSVTSTPSSSPLITKSASAGGGGSNRSEAEASSDDVDILFPPSSPGYLKSEEYRLLFRLPSDEVLVQDFNCAFQENILLQGHMYLFVRHICFYSNIFGYETKKAIPFNEVTCIRKAKTAGIFPNAIDIIAGGKRYFFASFLSCDEAYRAIVDGWAQYCDGIEDRIDRQSIVEMKLSRYQTSPGQSSCYPRPNPRQQRTSTPDRNTDVLLQGGHELSFGGSYGIVDVNVAAERPSEVEEIVEHTEPVVAAETSSSLQSLRWTPEDADAPQVPEFFTKVAESKFEIQVEEFFNHFFSDVAVDFVESFHKRCGDKDFRCSSWYEHEPIGHARDVSFLHPIKLYLGAKFGQCQEVQKFRVYRNSHLVIETSQEVGDADYFRVQGLWDVKRVGSETNLCLVRVYVNVAFSKKTMWKGKIESNTIDECRDAYAIWMENQKALSKLESGVSSASVNPSLNAIPNDEVQLETVGPSELNDNSLEITTHAATNTKHSRNRSRRRESPVGRAASDASSTTSLLREIVETFCVYMKNQNRLPLILVIASISILILMQLSIIVLLARPPQVHVISQIDYMNSFGNNGGDKAEAVTWLEKRIHHLKDEMLMVETRLEKMRHQHLLLETYLTGLDFDIAS